MLELITFLLLQGATLFGTPAFTVSTTTSGVETTAYDDTTPVDQPLEIGDNGWGHD